MGLLKIFHSLQRSVRKRQAVWRILASEQHNQPVLNIHTFKTPNVGDLFCTPYRYFKELKSKPQLDIHDYQLSLEYRTNFIQQINQHSIIVGGGGLLNRGGFRRQMQLFNSLAGQGKKVVLWGVGHNDKVPETYGKINHYYPDISNIGLVGTRDYNMPGEWVPCVSALHTIFDQSFSETQEIGVVFHLDTVKDPEIVKKYKHLPHTSNTSEFETLIHFIGSSQKIITDSYHVMYWGMLLGKKVVVVPNSTKFYDFKYQPVISDFDHAISDLSKAQSYSGLLEECRTINYRFAEKVFNYLGL